jgi:hypothetical protein
MVMAAHDEIPWSDLAKVHDRLSHHYHRIDPGQLWTMASVDHEERFGPKVGFADQLAADSSKVIFRSSAAAIFWSVVSVAPTPPASRRATAA